MSDSDSAIGPGKGKAATPELPTPILEVLNLIKVFPNGRTVLNGISFQVFPEETFVILGGSGCGKSTLLNILIGVLEPTSGEVRIFGENLHRLQGDKLKALHVRCGMLFQSGALIESLSLLGNVHLPLREHYRSVDPAVLMETARLKLRMVGLEEHGSKRPSGISGGMKKRVALARALALDPDLVFADEPTSGLDPVSTQEIDEMFMRLTRRIGAAAIVVTHDIASFFRIAHRAIMLGSERDGALQGRIILQGDTQKFRASDHPIVRRFLDFDRGGQDHLDAVAKCPGGTVRS
ncbi:MAG: ATP-binding cassette domain-containing protein [Verrucomicrobia bacterium]|nr:ATP-binding cassette domain-containing protein [Verrucomicrobiota bacterium]MBV8378711.1 ATP-binding cassette domain-containing protein [Verrucomicrobiota bacterium]